MTESEFALLESTFGVTLPAIYREFALSLPPPDVEQDRWECADVSELIRENQSLRDDGWYDIPWPAHLFCIGAHDGNHFFIDLTDPSKGVFYANHEEEFDPEDFSALHSGSLEEFCAPSQTRTPAPFASAWTAGVSEGTMTVTELPDFSLEAVEAAVRRLDGFETAEVSLSRSPGFMPLEPAALTISGGPRGYFIEAMVGDDTFHFHDPKASPHPLKIFAIDPELELPGQSICHDLEEVIKVLGYFFDTGGDLPWIQWVKEIAPNN